jgi:FMN phosphatase YigB (HAD superfamily)
MSVIEAKPILFVDFDGTLCHDRYWRSLPPDMFAEAQQFLFGRDNSLVVEWMLGKKTAEEINTILAKHLGVPSQDLWELFVDDCETMKVKQSTLDTINSLRSRYTTILITGNMDSFTRFTVPALELDTYFDYITNSADAGVLKSDESGKQFLDLAKSSSVNIADCVLIDDSEKICALFECLGGTALQITSEHSIDTSLSQLTKKGE